MKKQKRKELKDSEREYPTPPKDGMITQYNDGIVLCGSWASRLEEWRAMNLHRIKKGF